MMIAKISQGGGFRGALDYIFKESAEVVGGNMAGDDPRSLAKEFGVTRALREDIEKPCYHVSIALPEGEALDSKEWEKVANKYLSRLGISPADHQCVFVRHKDTEYDHLHILTSRIALDGRVWKPEFDKMKSKDICRQLEREHGLTVVSNDKKKHRAKTTQKERQMNKRTGRDSEKVFVQEKMNLLFADGARYTPQTLSKELEDNGIIMIPNVASTGKINGFSFQYAGRNLTGSQVGYSWKYLEPHLILDDSSISWMQERRRRLQEGTPADAVRSLRNAVWEVGIQGVQFEGALEKQGWTLEGDRLKKGNVEYSLSSIIDTDTLRENLKTLEGFSKEAKAKAQAKSRELAKHYHARPRKTFLAEMMTEDMICSMLLFPQVTVFLLVLSVLAEAVRYAEKPRTEEEFKEQMHRIWREADGAVQAEVSRVKGEITDARAPRRDKANIPVAEKAGRGFREEDDGRGSGLLEVGKGAYTTSHRIEGSAAGDERNRRPITVEAKDVGDDGGFGFSGGSRSSASGVGAPGGEPSNDAPAPSMAIEEWASLAQDLNLLTGDETMAKSESTLAKEKAWERQHSALTDENGFVRYRITCVPRVEIAETDTKDEDGRYAWIPGRRGDVEHFYTAEEVREKIPMLSRKNLEGYDIYVRPITERYIYVMIDDLSSEAVEAMKADGYKPSAVWETSKDNHQVVFKLEKSTPSHYNDPVREAEKVAGDVLVRELTKRYGGDSKNLGIKKSFRLAGYSNKKPERNNEFTRVLETRVEECPVLKALWKERTAAAITSEVEKQTEERRAYISGKTTFVLDKSMTASLDCVKAFTRHMRREEGLVRYKGWTHDQSTVDYRVCVAMLKDGWHADSVANCLERLSPELPARHRDTDDYVSRTMKKAIGTVEKERVKEQAKEQSRGSSGPLFGL